MDLEHRCLLRICVAILTFLHEAVTLGVSSNRSTTLHSTGVGETLVNFTKVVHDAVNATGETNSTTSSGGSPDQTLTITIASLAVSVAIVIFICVAYKFHALQLDAKKKEIAHQLLTCQYPSQCLTGSPGPSDAHKDSMLPVSSQSQSDSETATPSGRRKSSRTQTSPLLSAPLSLSSKRGSRCSTWSSSSDHDTCTSSAPRRHSSFVL